MTESSEPLRQWVDNHWSELKLNDFSVKAEFNAQDEAAAPGWQALPGDAGFRAYYRLASEPPLLAVSAPPATEKNKAFMEVGQLLRKGGVLAPAVAACDLDQGFFIVEDFGPTLLLDVLTDNNVERLYNTALSTLGQIQRCVKDAKVLPEYSAELLREELNLFPEWFVSQLLGIDLSEREVAVLERTFHELIELALEQPTVVVHRDFHSRNLVYREDGPPGVIDFQDAVIGPCTYDLVSLLRDCYVQWPEAQVQAWVTQFYQSACKSGQLRDIDEDTFYRWFDWMGLQRHIKVLGIFARLSLRDGKHRYLSDLPLVIHYTLSIARKYEEFDQFVEWFEGDIMAAVKQQAWWNPEFS